MADRRRWLFPALALSLPFLLLGAVEGGLRLTGRGATPPLFVEAPVGGGRYLVANPQIARRWFPGDARPPGPSPELMRREKPVRGFRVFVLGESAAQGFPWPRTGAFSRPLAQMLRDALPGDTVEVINLGIAATNSFAMLDLASSRRMRRMRSSTTAVTTSTTAPSVRAPRSRGSAPQGSCGSSCGSNTSISSAPSPRRSRPCVVPRLPRRTSPPKPT